jgi:hypothetical protein
LGVRILNEWAPIICYFKHLHNLTRENIPTAYGLLAM